MKLFFIFKRLKDPCLGVGMGTMLKVPEIPQV